MKAYGGAEAYLHVFREYEIVFLVSDSNLTHYKCSS